MLDHTRYYATFLSSDEKRQTRIGRSVLFYPEQHGLRNRSYSYSNNDDDGTAKMNIIRKSMSISFNLPPPPPVTIQMGERGNRLQEIGFTSGPENLDYGRGTQRIQQDDRLLHCTMLSTIF